MKNKKGFTLIELVIAIGLLSIFAITIGISLNRTFKSQKLKEQQEFVEKIKSSANLYATNNSNIVNNLSKDKGFVTINIEDLTKDGYLSENTIDPKTNEKVDKSQKIKISYDANGTIKIDYPYDKEDDYLQALDIYINLGNNSITDYCFHDLGTSNLSYVNSETGSFEHDYITSKGTDGNYQNINCNQGKINTSLPGTYRIIYNYKLKNKNTWKRKTRNVVVIDNVAPTCVITGNREANAPWRYEGLTDFSVGCKDAGGCLNVTQPKSPLINMKTESVTIQDKAGNKTVCTLNVYSDQIKPVCTQIDPPTTWTNQNRNIITKCEDTLSGCVQNTISRTYYGDAEKDNFPIYDKAGNAGNCLVDVMLDKTPPTVSLSQGITNEPNAAFISGYATDNLSGIVKYQLSNNPNLTTSSPGWETITPNKTFGTGKIVKTPGSTTWYFYVIDVAGNMSRSSALTVNVNAPVPTAPTLNISNPYQVRSGGAVSANVTWSPGQDVNGYCIQQSSLSAPTTSSSCWVAVSTNTITATKPITLNGKTGSYYFVAYVKNTSGKISEVSNVSYGQIIDSPPSAPILNINPYSVTSGGSITAKVSWTGSEDVNAFCVVKKGSAKPSSSSSCWNSVATTKTTGTYSFKISGSPGKYYYVAYVKNIYGEVSAASNEDYGQINATTPTAPRLSTNTTVTTVGNTVNLTASWTSGENVNAYCIQSSSLEAPTPSSSCWVSTSNSSGTRSVILSSAGTYSYKAYVKNTSNLISSASNVVTISVNLADINQYGDKYYCWYVTYNNSNQLMVNTKDDASTLESSLICRDKPSGYSNIYNILKYSTLTYSDYWGESAFTKSNGTHTYGWYKVTGSVEPSGTHYYIHCYAAFYYTAKDCSECVNDYQCTTTREPR